MSNREDQGAWEEHRHEAIVHTHPHYHVTHNYDHRVGGFHHLSSHHEHEHDHSEVTHAHYPHADFESEPRDEAHVHDHGVPVKKARDEGTAKRSPSKAKTSGTKKSPSA